MIVFRRKERGFAALLMVITLSLSLMIGLLEAGNFKWRLLKDVGLLADRTQRQLAAESCYKLALLYLSEDPDFVATSTVVFGHNVKCSIDFVVRVNGSFSPFADRVIHTTGVYKDGASTLSALVGVSNSGLIEKKKVFEKFNSF